MGGEGGASVRNRLRFEKKKGLGLEVWYLGGM